MKLSHRRLINDALKLIAEAKGKLEDVSMDMHDKYDDGTDHWQDGDKAQGKGWSISCLDDMIYNTMEDMDEQLRSLMKDDFNDRVV